MCVWGEGVGDLKRHRRDAGIVPSDGRQHARIIARLQLRPDDRAVRQFVMGIGLRVQGAVALPSAPPSQLARTAAG